MTPIRIASCAALLLASTALLAPAAARDDDGATTALSSKQGEVYAQAVQSFRDQRYSSAYARFAQLADAGHLPSAQIALVMHRNGNMLFRSGWAASLEQQRRWNALVAEGTRIPLMADYVGD